MDAQFSAYAWANDQRIQQLTGQPFTQAYRDHILGAANGRFDSGPATLALTAVAQTAPERELDALHALQHARYVEGLDKADPAVIANPMMPCARPCWSAWPPLAPPCSCWVPKACRNWRLRGRAGRRSW